MLSSPPLLTLQLLDSLPSLMAPSKTSTLETILRLVNIVVSIIGLVLVGFGLYLVFTYKWEIPQVEGTVLGLGVVDCTLGLLLVVFGFRSLFYLR